MYLTRLRLSGFKSFVDPTELWIEPGLTGIVGPNGCGKSNLVEALRWVMGESSAKKLRGSEMDDVIFSGTEGRPARNIAEVSLQLDNSQRRAPASFNDADDLEVTRRIERGAGSSFHVSGKEVRARDVQTLFADAATGAQSTAMVDQGRIGQMIRAKPINRRGILEEAAGITGLHSRRHEAELRLRAADTNLERVDDVLATLETHLGGLKRQARQAARYRRIGDHIRRAEAIVLHLRWQEATAAQAAAREELAEAERQVTELTGRASAAATEQAQAAAKLPDLRHGEAEAGATLQRLVLEREGLDAEEARLADARRDCEQRLLQISADIEREKALAADAAAALARIAEDEETLAAATQGEGAAQATAADGVTTATAEMRELESELTRLTEELAAGEAGRAALERRLAEIAQRRARLDQRGADIERQRAELAGKVPDEGALETAEAAVSAAEKRLTAARAEAEGAERKLAEAGTADQAARDALQAEEARHAKTSAEAEALAELLGGPGDGDLPAVIDEVTVEAGYEMALGTALGDDLSAPVHEHAPVRWEAATTTPMAAPPLPNGAVPLSKFVAAPSALARRLAQIGVVADETTGRVLRSRLAQGQRLVTRDGALWRWDGFTVAAGAPTAAATRLRQNNRLEELRTHLRDGAGALAAARQDFEAAQAAARTAAAALTEARAELRTAQAEADEARDTHAALAREVAAHGARRAALREAEARLASDRDEAAQETAQVRAALDALAPAESRRTAAAALKERLETARARLVECRGAHDRLLREAAGRAERLATLTEERRGWQTRADAASRQLTTLDTRRETAIAEQAELAQRPETIASRRTRLMDLVETAQGRRRQAADALAKAETRLAEADKRLKLEEGALGAAREARVRADSRAEHGAQACQLVAERITERLGCVPEEALAAGAVKEGEELADIEAVEKRLERLLRERDNMGPVNLRAETEAAEIEEQIAVLQSERGDLVSAIARLRQGIGGLNREARQRLLAAFEKVNRHFQDLFVKLFGGGRAYMKLTESDDPLEAGLEIYARPPGKRLQALSLLSGGEQALTAISLLFAVFLTNPAPICVLDEVDAPLDDANVDRFCGLIDEIAHTSQTRFLVITHHRMTMARMDRLFGLTMAEHGISQLVSVDLEDAARLRATA